jgi:hypothetical protein
MTRPDKSDYRVMLGRQRAYAAESPAGGFIGACFGTEQDRSRPDLRRAVDGVQRHTSRRVGPWHPTLRRSNYLFLSKKR